MTLMLFQKVDHPTDGMMESTARAAAAEIPETKMHFSYSRVIIYVVLCLMIGGQNSPWPPDRTHSESKYEEKTSEMTVSQQLVDLQCFG